MRAKEWRGSFTEYAGLSSTRPSAEHKDKSFPEVCEVLAPERGVRLVEEKARVPYLTPGLLQDAELVGKTREAALARGLSTVGMQRSASHVTTANFVLFDFDGVPVEAFALFLARLRTAGIAWLFFTSFSMGTAGKPGIRGRVVVPVDENLDAAGYEAAWRGANALWFGGLADPSSRLLHQAQGTWAVHPDRKEYARRAGNFDPQALVASAAELIGHAPAVSPKPKAKAKAEPTQQPPSSEQVAEALAVIGTAPPEWLIRRAGAPERVRDGEGRESAVLQLVGRLRSAGVPENVIASTAEHYNAAHVVPPLDSEVLMARIDRYAGEGRSDPTLFAYARDWAEERCISAARSGVWTGTRASWTYLARWHPKTWARVGEQRQAEMIEGGRDGT